MFIKFVHILLKYITKLKFFFDNFFIIKKLSNYLYYIIFAPKLILFNFILLLLTSLFILFIYSFVFAFIYKLHIFIHEYWLFYIFISLEILFFIFYIKNKKYLNESKNSSIYLIKKELNTIYLPHDLFLDIFYFIKYKKPNLFKNIISWLILIILSPLLSIILIIFFFYY